MPVVARFPPPSSQAIAAAQKGGRVEFVLSADGVSWDALPVTADLATASSEAAGSGSADASGSATPPATRMVSGEVPARLVQTASLLLRLT